MSKLVDQAVGLVASASAVASYLKKKLTEKDDTQIVELYSEESNEKKTHGAPVQEDSYLEIADDREELAIVNYAPRTVSAGVPLPVEQMITMENDTDDVEALMFNYPLDFEEEDNPDAREVLITEETETEVNEDFNPDEETLPEPDFGPAALPQQPAEEVHETKQEDTETVLSGEDALETAMAEGEIPTVEEPVTEPVDEETADMMERLDTLVAQTTDIGYQPVEEEIEEPNVDAIMAATRVADETIEEIARDIAAESMPVSEQEINAEPLDIIEEPAEPRGPVSYEQVLPSVSVEEYQPDPAIAHIIDEVVEKDITNTDFVDNIDRENEQLEELTRKVVDLSQVSYPEDIREPISIEEPRPDVLTSNTQNLFKEINNIPEPVSEPEPDADEGEDFFVKQPVQADEHAFRHLTESRISKIRNQLENMLEAIGEVDRVYLKHYAVFDNYSNYWSFKKVGESLGYEVTDMNEQNEAFMYKEYDSGKTLLLHDILTLADTLKAYHGNYRGWKVVERGGE